MDDNGDPEGNKSSSWEAFSFLEGLKECKRSTTHPHWTLRHIVRVIDILVFIFLLVRIFFRPLANSSIKLSAFDVCMVDDLLVKEILVRFKP